MRRPRRATPPPPRSTHREPQEDRHPSLHPTVQLYDAADLQHERFACRFTLPVRQLCFGRNGSLLMAGADDGNIRVLDPKTTKARADVALHVPRSPPRLRDGGAEAGSSSSSRAGARAGALARPPRLSVAASARA